MIGYAAAVVVVLLIVLVVTLGCPTQDPAQPAQIAAFHVLKEVRALSNNKASRYLSSAASSMGQVFPSKCMPSLEEARTIYTAFSSNIPVLEASSNALQTSAITMVQKDSSGATADLAGWMIQAGTSIRAIIGLVRILGGELS